MKLAELLNVDTTKENWFKLLSKKGINPKTVNAVSKGGGGEGGEVKEWYYKVITQDPMIGDIMSMIGIIYFIVEFKGEIKETLNIPGEGFTNNIYAIKLLDIPFSFATVDEGEITTINGVFNGDIYDRYLKFRELAGAPDFTREDAIAELSQYIQEITKEEYESLITQ